MRERDEQYMQRETGRVFDEYLVLLATGGDRRAAEQLARRWQPRLLATARRLLRDEEQARATVQQAWVSILRGLGGLRDPARFGPWAFGILHRRCADRIRAETRRRAHETPEPPDLATCAPEQAADERAAIAAAFAALPPEQRFAAHLFYVEGFSLGEIARAADCPEGTVKSRLFHARRQLKAALSGDKP